MNRYRPYEQFGAIIDDRSQLPTMSRNTDIDCTKGLLTIGMVFAHVIQFIDNGQSKILHAMSDLGNFVSFSGFVFCFGFASWSAYLSKYNIPWLNVCKTSLKCLFAYFISGIAYRLILVKDLGNFNFFLNILTFRVIPGYSEFLLSFSLILIFSCTIRPVIQTITRNSYIYLTASTALLLIPYVFKYVDLDFLLFNFLYGKNAYPFPIIQYFPIFLLGIFIARHRYKYNIIFLIASLTGVCFFYGCVFLGIHVNRFPPDTAWILCSASCAFLYYGFGKFIAIYFPVSIKLYIDSVGRNVLFYLLISNLLLFTRGSTKTSRLGYEETISFYISIMILCYIFCQFIHNKITISSSNNITNCFSSKSICSNETR